MEDKRIRKFSKLSAVGFIIMAIMQFFGSIALILNIYVFTSISSFSISSFISGLVLSAIYLAFAVLLLKGKNGTGLTAVAGVFLLYQIYSLIHYHNASSTLTFLMAATILALTLFDVTPALKDKKSMIKFLWVLPPIFELLSYVVTTVLMAKNILSSAQEQLADASQQTIAVVSILIPQVILMIIEVLTICFFSYRFYALSKQPEEEEEDEENPLPSDFDYHPFG